jgi:hypothetical protein
MTSRNLEEIFNIVLLHLPVPRTEAALFIGHFTYKPDQEFYAFKSGSPIASFYFKAGKMTVFATDFTPEDLRPKIADVQTAIDKYFESQKKMQLNAQAYIDEQKKKDEEAEQKRIRENPLGYMNEHKPFRTIGIDSLLPPGIDENTFMK